MIDEGKIVDHILYGAGVIIIKCSGTIDSDAHALSDRLIGDVKACQSPYHAGIAASC